MSSTATDVRVRVAKTGPAVREALAGFDTVACQRFEVEFDAALKDTSVDWDLSRMEALVGRWWAYVMDRLNPDPIAEAARARVGAGDESDVTERWRLRPDGSHDVYRKDTDESWMFSYNRPAGGS